MGVGDYFFHAALILFLLLVLVTSLDASLGRICCNADKFRSGVDTAIITCTITDIQKLKLNNVSIALIKNKAVYPQDKLVQSINSTSIQLVLQKINYTSSGWYDCINKNTNKSIVNDWRMPCGRCHIYVGFQPVLPNFKIQLLGGRRLFGSYFPNYTVLMNNTKIPYDVKLLYSFRTYSRNYTKCNVTKTGFSCRDLVESPKQICFLANISNILGKSHKQWCNKTNDLRMPLKVGISDIQLKYTSESVSWRLPQNRKMDRPDWGFPKITNYSYTYIIVLQESKLGNIIYSVVCSEESCGTERGLKKLVLKPYTLYVVNIRRQWKYYSTPFGLQSYPTEKHFRTKSTYPAEVKYKNGWFRLYEKSDKTTELEIWWLPLKQSYWHDRYIRYAINFTAPPFVNVTVLCKFSSTCIITNLKKGVPISFTIYAINSVGKSLSSKMYTVNPKSIIPVPDYDVERLESYKLSGLYNFIVYLNNLWELPQRESLSIYLHVCTANVTSPRFCENLKSWKRQISFDKMYQIFSVDVSDAVAFHINYFSVSASSENSFSGLARLSNCFYGKDVLGNLPIVSAKQNEKYITFTFKSVTCSVYGKSRVLFYIFYYKEIENSNLKTAKFPAFLCSNSSERICVFSVKSSQYKNYTFKTAVLLKNNETINFTDGMQSVEKLVSPSNLPRTWIIIGSVAAFLVFCFAVVLVAYKLGIWDYFKRDAIIQAAATPHGILSPGNVEQKVLVGNEMLPPAEAAGGGSAEEYVYRGDPIAADRQDHEDHVHPRTSSTTTGSVDLETPNDIGVNLYMGVAMDIGLPEPVEVNYQGDLELSVSTRDGGYSPRGGYDKRDDSGPAQSPLIV